MSRSFSYCEDTGIIGEIPFVVAGNPIHVYGIHGSQACCVAGDLPEANDLTLFYK
ncbi:MAG: hypothetical protein U0L12_06565 [Ruminococcus sp.]|nr:hypothetical protein [Ruminococcus sp.]